MISIGSNGSQFKFEMGIFCCYPNRYANRSILITDERTFLCVCVCVCSLFVLSIQFQLCHFDCNVIEPEKGKSLI